MNADGWLNYLHPSAPIFGETPFAVILASA
jgi:hypothetical protein